MTEEQAKKTFERALKMEQEFGEYFTGIFTFFFLKFTFLIQIFVTSSSSLLLTEQLLFRVIQLKKFIAKQRTSFGLNLVQLYGCHLKKIYDQNLNNGHFRRVLNVGQSLDLDITKSLRNKKTTT